MVRKDSVTACLPLTKLINEGFPAGYEGYITAISGMMFANELTLIIPWITYIQPTALLILGYPENGFLDPSRHSTERKPVNETVMMEKYFEK